MVKVPNKELKSGLNELNALLLGFWNAIVTLNEEEFASILDLCRAIHAVISLRAVKRDHFP